MIMIFLMDIKISMQMNVFNDSDCISMATESLHLHIQLNDRDRNSTLSQNTNFRLFQNERVCGRQFQI